MDEVQMAIEDLLVDGRICPQPEQWQCLWDMLPNKSRRGAGWDPALPLILAAWWETDAAQKRLRLTDHLRWAEKHGALSEVMAFLRSLNAEQWYREN